MDLKNKLRYTSNYESILQLSVFLIDFYLYFEINLHFKEVPKIIILFAYKSLYL